MILSDFDLKNYLTSKRLRISPLDKSIIRENGVDLRLGREIARLKRSNKIMDTRGQHPVHEFYIREAGESFTVRSGERILAHTIEKLSLPADLMGFVELRSTYARLGLSLPPTIIDAGFTGQLTVELIGSSFPVKLYGGDRFLHVIFSKLLNPVERPYKGRYSGQKGVTLPKLE